MFGNLH